MQVTVSLGARSYPVHIVDDGFRGLSSALASVGLVDKRVIVTETTVGPLYAEMLRKEVGDVPTIVLPAGESNKTVETWRACVDQLLALGVDRKTAIIALGGGVLGDIAGFAASATMRGLPFVQVPTTLLAMVDSSVGGKTAVNHPRGKNLVGAFHQPALVWAALSTLKTLDARQTAAGMAEVVKTALIGDVSLLGALEEEERPEQLKEWIGRCVAAKARVVSQDERETGVRAILNAGHTVGHGLEAALGYGTLLHGEAVAIGLVYEAAWAVRSGVCTDTTLPDRLSRLLERFGCPVAIPSGTKRDQVIAAMRLDKKASRNTLALPVPSSAGTVRIVELPWSELSSLLLEP